MTSDMCMNEADITMIDSLSHEEYHDNLKRLFTKQFAHYRCNT